MSKNMLKTVFLLLFLLTSALLFAQKITVNNARLTVNGSQIFLAGGNTPWNNWNDLGGSYNSSWWDAEFARIKAAGGNCTRIWITCDGEVGFNMTSNGLVSGMTDKFWTDMDSLMSLAQKNQIYVLATLMSFDHVKNTHTNYQRWRNMLTSSSNVDAFANNFVTPLVNRYRNNPYLFAIEPCNEIEWINQNSECGQIAWNYLQYFAARVFAAVHRNSSILTTIGLSMKWQTDAYSEGNLFSDSRLKAQYNDSSVYLDVYSPHFYDWVIEWFGNPFDNATVASYQLTDKPVIIGEFPANGAGGKSITDCMENAYRNGFQGTLPWTTNGVDSNGSLSSGLGAALTTFKNKHPSLINPPGSTATPAPTSTVKRGDVNGSNIVDIVDALMIAQYYVGLNPPGFNTAVADTNNDGRIDIIDALRVAQYYVGLIPSL